MIPTGIVWWLTVSRDRRNLEKCDFLLEVAIILLDYNFTCDDEIEVSAYIVMTNVYIK